MGSYDSEKECNCVPKEARSEPVLHDSILHPRKGTVCIIKELKMKNTSLVHVTSSNFPQFSALCHAMPQIEWLNAGSPLQKLIFNPM
jgi:hypothetical protein